MSDLEKNPIKDLIEGDFVQRVHEVTPDICSFDSANQQIEAWRLKGRFSVFNAGTYDILTLNHILGLVQCRTLGAMALIGLNKIETKTEQHLVHDIAASDSIHLMVTLDTNRALEEGKSRRPEKGGAPKPTLDWYSRAIMLAMQSIPSPGYEARRGVVDYITRHGPECCGVCQDGSCINEDNALMTVKLQPDLVVINSESLRTVADMEQFKEEGLLPNTQIAIIREEENQYYDPILNGPVKTTSIIQRVRS
jgi:hypothetical protein